MKRAELLKQHEDWLKKMGVKVGKQVRRSPYNIPNLTADLRKTVPTSDTVGNGFAKRVNAYSGSDSLIVGQAYNKGNYVVLSKSEAADPATGKRR